MSFGYTDHDQQRRRYELRFDSRDSYSGACSAFERDRRRLWDSHALRRLSNVTQVDEPDAGVIPHNRLTHSLDVAGIGTSLARELGADVAVVETACLAHDLGCPPFGRNGEQVLDACARARGLSFDATAQTLRILTHLECDYPNHNPEGGLNLTRAVLDATCKYPWGIEIGGAKHGVYAEDSATLQWIRDDAPDHQLCFEAQIMDWADDIANTVADLVNGLLSGAVVLAALADRAERAEIAEMARTYFSDIPADEIDCYAVELIELPAVVALTAPEASATTIAVARRMLTRRFIAAAVRATRIIGGSEPLGRYRGELVVPARARGEIAVLEALHLRNVLCADGLRARRTRQRDVLGELFEALLNRPDALDPSFARSWEQADTDTARVRVVLDQIASLTDRRAAELHSRVTAYRNLRRPHHGTETVAITAFSSRDASA
ncbi:deoxyguanosinetriphosphate triphosphohydrolase [Nocardia amamiensis]|uniref:Deoxyguanosinetriphosphate triphosphohydrolase n=1 Tax=Nocardia amamiensis TaxID=404578 RepID=A0ABS0D2I6_9NOCA|nr:deoxyguanosinetriphosphate triphosphohydrolase [Nocardia amamiensis]MBF6303053.1 deoxyguanosinetriphosphate triphosphohydrolase [Nocardia amamiensis]